VPVPGPLVIAGVLLLILLTLLLYLKIARAFPLRRAALLIALRSLALLALFMSALQPTVSHDLVIPRKTELIVMVDTSKSMTIRDVSASLLPPEDAAQPRSEELTRGQAVREALRNANGLRSLERRFNLHAFSFDSFAKTAILGELDPEAAHGEFTDIGSALRSAFKQVEGDISAAVLLTDGADNGRLPLSSVVDELKAPIYAVGVGNPGPRRAAAGREIAIASVEYDRRVVLNERATLRVNVYHRDFEGAVPVELKLNDAVLDSQGAALGTKEKNTWVTLHFTPSSEGLFTYHVAVAPQPGEQTVTNNVRKLTIEVQRKETCVLYLAGEPSFDYKFIKHLVEEDPILRFTGLVRFSPERLYRQGQWPENQSLDMKTFDVVILANMDREFLATEQLEVLRESVEEDGKGLVVLGGPNAFSSGGYAGTPLSKALPAALAAGQDAYQDSEFETLLTTEGADHPVFSFLSDIAKNREMWGALPKSSGINFGLSPKPGATVLALARTTTASAPLVLIQTYGKGRCMAIAARYTWPWRGTRAGQSCFERFWSQALRWIAAREEIQLKEGERLRFWTDKDDYNAGDEVRMEALLTNERGKLTSTADVLARIVTPDKEQTPVNLVSTDELGRYRGSYTAKMSGEYEVEVLAKQEDFLLGNAASRFTVGSTLAELDQAEMNEALLTAIGSRSGGAYVPLRDLGKLPSMIPHGRQTELRRESAEVWSSPYFLAAFVALVTAEWVLRKRFHMV
jgi:uncharacterized membrane protein